MALLCTAAFTAVAHGGILARLDQGEKLTITAIGTSLTASNLWLSQLGAWLNEKYPGQVTLFNEGVGASASKNNAAYKAPPSGLDVQLGKVLAHHPDVVFLEFAMNDAYTPYKISPKESKENLQTMITTINRWAEKNHKHVDIIVQTMNNVLGGSKDDELRPNLPVYYQGYRDVVAANPGVLLIDHAPNWLKLYNSQPDHATWKSYVLPDGIHPNGTGSLNVIVPEIQRALLKERDSAKSSHL
jgi:lysophospholipase L1-like esterase